MYYYNPYYYWPMPVQRQIQPGQKGNYTQKQYAPNPMLQGYGQNKSYKSLEEALVGVRKAVQGEREDELFYDYLIAVAPTTEDKEIITSIRNDEQKHNKMFRQIYRDFTGEEITDTDDESFQKPNSFEEGVKKALFGELAAVEKYRDIRAGLPTRYYRDMVFEILTDELKHADKYNYILTITIARKKV